MFAGIGSLQEVAPRVRPLETCFVFRHIRLSSFNGDDEIAGCGKRAIARDRSQTVHARLRKMGCRRRLVVGNRYGTSLVERDLPRSAILHPSHAQTLWRRAVSAVDLRAECWRCGAGGAGRAWLGKTIIHNRGG